MRKTKSTYWEDISLLNNSDGCGYKKGKLVDNKCMRCLNGGFYDKEKDACVYWTTGAYGSCSKDMNGCRKYTGNQGNDIESIASLSFEPQGKDDNAINEAKDGWSPANSVSIAAEALQVSLHSLQVKGGMVGYELPAGDMSKGSLYTLSFWARGENLKTEVYFKQNGDNVGTFTLDIAKQATTKLSIGYDWREYHLGPVTFTGESGNTTTLEFQAVPAGKIYFLDNLQLSRLNDTYHLIKDSWKTTEGFDVPTLCDANPEDPYPGKALGCRAYTQDSTGLPVYATGFENLCREEAVGCRAVYDTYNTEESNLILYNVWCAVTSTPQNGKCVKTITVEGVKETRECDVPQNAKGCFIDKMVVPDGASQTVWSGWVVSSTIVIPADTPADSPIFLTVHKKFQCTENKLGCQNFGLEDKILPTVVSSTEAYLLNNPAKYIGPDGILCRNDLVGCEEFKAGNDVVFFKEPKLVGNTLCEYKSASQGSGISLSGWLQKDVGYCYDPDDERTDKLCRSSDDCGKDYSCKDIGTAPCYQNYLLPGGEYGLWSNGNVNYAGMVGICPEEANNCRELIDPMDKDKQNSNDLGRAYYVIFDQKLLAGLSECEGSVSWKKGCVLFNKTDQPNLLHDANATYNASAKSTPPHGLVSPASSAKNDANKIIKVTRDRECGEWLACRGSLPIPDSQSQSGERYACYALQPCKGGNNFNCTAAASAEEYGAGQLLNYEKYVTRDVSWFTGQEYDGYSLFGKYPVADFDFVSIDKTDTYDNKPEEKLVLGYVNEDQNGICNGVSSNGKKCGLGVCYEHECVYALEGKYPTEFTKKTNQEDKTKSFSQYLPANACRAYPEQNSPFTDKAKTIVQSWANGRPVGTDNKYANSALCQDKENCDCNYVTIGYGQGGSVTENRYYGWNSKHSDVLLGGICQGGPNEGQSCATADICGDAALGAQCIKPQKKSKLIGWNGYCLERDISRRINNRTDNSPDAFACLTWYPLDYAPGLFDIYYNDPGRGYVPPVPGAGEVYCASASAVNNLVPEEGSKQTAPSFSDEEKVWYEYESPNDVFPCKQALGNLSADHDFICNNIEGVDWCKNTGAINFKNYSLNAYYADLTYDCFSTLPGLKPYFHFSITQYYNSIMDMLRSLPANKDGDFDSPSYEYVSRVDTNLGNDDDYFYYQVEAGYIPGSSDESSSPAGKVARTLLMSKLVMDKYNQSAGGVDQQTLDGIHKDKWWKPLFPEPNMKLKAGSIAGPNLFGDIADANHMGDSGIVINYPNNYEKWLNKKHILAVSLIPLVPECYNNEGDDDNCTHDEENAAFGYVHQVLMNGQYPAVSRVGDQSAILFNRSTLVGMSDCTFCKWWVAKTDYAINPIADENAEEVPTEGYLMQWWQKDPVNGDDLWPAYANNNTYLVNPLAQKADGSMALTCSEDDPAGVNWWAIEFLFNQDTGKFLGYRSRFCENMGSDDHGFSSAISWRLRPMCLKSAVAYNSDENTSNKALTDRIWAGSDFSVLSINNQSNLLKNSTPLQPFGSGLGGAEETKIGQIQPWYFSGDDTSVNNAGYPWSCGLTPSITGGLCSFTPRSSTEGMINIPGAALESGAKSINGLLNPTSWLASLRELFVKFFEVRDYAGVGAGEPAWKVSGNSTDEAQTTGKPPYIYPAVECLGEVCKLDKSQPIDKYGFSVNGIAGTDAANELYGVRNKATVARFFTWADHNQMPLRRIMMDWREQEESLGLGTVAGDTSGYYSNYKPYCADGGNVKECFKKFDLKQQISSEPVIGWLNKSAGDPSEKFQGPIQCAKTQDCIDDISAAIADGNWGNAEDYPALNSVGCNQTNKLCYEILKKAEFVNGFVEEWLADGWHKITCQKADTCFNTCNKFNLNGDSVCRVSATTTPIGTLLNNQFEYSCDKDFGECFMMKPTGYAANPIIGWKGKIQPPNYTEKEGQVSCTQNQDCKDKFIEMVASGFGTEADYPQSTDLLCEQSFCHQYEYVLDKTKPDEVAKLTGLTCRDTNECPTNYACVEVGAHFGNQSGLTCVDRPAQRFFNYTCDAGKYAKKYTNHSENDVNGIPQYVYKVNEIDSDFTLKVDGWKDLLIKNGQKSEDLVCVYKPRLQVLDNWGWCSGSCKFSTADNTRKGCYNGGGNEDKCEEKGGPERFIPFSNIIVVAP